MLEAGHKLRGIANQPQGEEGNTMYQLTVRNQRIRSDDLEYIMKISHMLQKRGYTNIDMQRVKSEI